MKRGHKQHQRRKREKLYNLLNHNFILIFAVFIALPIGTLGGNCQHENGDSKSFRLTNCNVMNIPDIPVHVEEVYLNENLIVHIRDDDFLGLEQCTLLSLKNNVIETIDDGAFQDMHSLTQLDLQWNSLKRMKANMFLGLESLITLKLGTNEIEDIDDGALNGLGQLVVLALDFNSLKAVRKEMWEGAPNIAELGLGGNDIAAIPPGTFANLPKLHTLNLRENDLASVSLDMFGDSGLPDTGNQFSLEVLGNPFQCDEEMCWLHESDSLHLPHPITCENYPGIPWSEIRFELACDYLYY